MSQATSLRARRFLAIPSLCLASCVARPIEPALVTVSAAVHEHTATLRWVGPDAKQDAPLPSFEKLDLVLVRDGEPAKVQPATNLLTAPGLCVVPILPEGLYNATLTLKGTDATPLPEREKKFSFEIKPSPFPTQLDAKRDFGMGAPIGIDHALAIHIGDGTATHELRQRTDWLLREYVRATIGPSSNQTLASIEESRARTESIGYQLDARVPVLLVVQLDAPEAAATHRCQLSLKVFDLALIQSTLEPLSSWHDRPLVYSDSIEIDAAIAEGEPRTGIALLAGWKSLVTSLAESPRWKQYLELVAPTAAETPVTDVFVDRDRQTLVLEFLQLRCPSFESANKNDKTRTASDVADELFFGGRLDAEVSPAAEKSGEDAAPPTAESSGSQPPANAESSPPVAAPPVTPAEPIEEATPAVEPAAGGGTRAER